MTIFYEHLKILKNKEKLLFKANDIVCFLCTECVGYKSIDNNYSYLEQ